MLSSLYAHAIVVVEAIVVDVETIVVVVVEAIVVVRRLLSAYL